MAFVMAFCRTDANLWVSHGRDKFGQDLVGSWCKENMAVGHRRNDLRDVRVAGLGGFERTVARRARWGKGK